MKKKRGGIGKWWSQPRPAGNRINPFQFATYKDKVDLKKRLSGAACGPKVQTGIPPRLYRKYAAHKTKVLQ